MRVLLYANVDAAEAGGVQAVMRGLAARLAAQGHRVTTGWAERSAPAAAPDDGWAEAFYVRPGQRRWWHLPTLARLGLRLLRERPQVVNIHFASPSVRYFTALAPWFGFRVALTCHGSDVLRPLPHDAAHLGPVIAGADAVTVVSEDIAARLAQDGLAPARPPAVIANGVDTDFWQPAPASRAAASALSCMDTSRAAASAPSGADASRAEASALPHLVALGRLQAVKGFDLLIEAAAHLAARGTRLKLTIIGEGSEGDALAARATRLGIAHTVTFAGRLRPPAIRDLFHRADLFVLPSRSEGMPLAMMEAMASGLPVVAADVGGVARTAGGAALLVPPERPDALAEAIGSLVGDKSEQRRTRLRRQARTRARAFSADAGHAAYATLLAELARKRRRA